MNRQQQDVWRDEALSAVLTAISASPDLVSRLVFKGARVLRLRLGTHTRASFDIDAGLTPEFLEQFTSIGEQTRALEELLRNALDGHFSRETVVRYTVQRLVVRPSPSQAGHRHGWTGFIATIALNDTKYQGVRGMPTLTVDFSAPERLSAGAIALLEVDGGTVTAQTTERIIGEKMRAFLQSLPEYVNKLSRGAQTVRVKDLYDVADVLRRKPIEDAAFWGRVADEFRSACASRLVDCVGMASFGQELDVTRSTYRNDATIPKDISFELAWLGLEEVVKSDHFSTLLPLSFPLPSELIGPSQNQ